MIYVNEIDPYCAAWLQNLMDADVLPRGHIDTRSIEDVTPNDLAGYTQHHFFAGLGGWIYALDLAGWPRDRPVWTGSCPCQPFSAAGKGAGFEDERHLWPAWQHLIAQCRPPAIFGEQVASKSADDWIDLVHADLEGMGYAFGCLPFPAASVGAPHIRDRMYWCGVGLADSDHPRLEGRQLHAERAAELAAWPGVLVGGLADTNGRNASTERKQRGGQQRQQPQDGGAVWMGHTSGIGRFGREGLSTGRVDDRTDAGRVEGHDGSFSSNQTGFQRVPAAGPTNGFWRATDWLGCTDGKWRPVEPGTFPLAHGIPGRVGRLRAYGNAIVPQVAAAFVASYLEAEGFTAIEAAA